MDDEPLDSYLAEWYRAELTDPAGDPVVVRLVSGGTLLAADGSSATVLTRFAVPSDGVIFCVFSAVSADAVKRACADEGIPAERVTEAFVGAASRA